MTKIGISYMIKWHMKGAGVNNVSLSALWPWLFLIANTFTKYYYTTRPWDLCLALAEYKGDGPGSLHSHPPPHYPIPTHRKQESGSANSLSLLSAAVPHRFLIPGKKLVIVWDDWITSSNFTFSSFFHTPKGNIDHVFKDIYPLLVLLSRHHKVICHPGNHGLQKVLRNT